MVQLVAAAGRPRFQLAKQFFGDGAQAFLCQRAEHDHFVQTAHELWPEPLFRFFDGLRRLLFKHSLAARRKAQRSALPRQEARTEVRGEQHDGVAEIGLAAHGIGELPIFQNLQKDVLDIRMRLLDLVKQYDTVGAAAYRFGQLAALIVAEIARRSPQQAGGSVLFLILGHVELEQGFLAAEPAYRQRPGKSGLAHAGGTEEQHGSDGPARLAKAGAAAADGPCHGGHSTGLPDDLRIQTVFQLIQPFPLLLTYPLHRHTAGLRHHMGDIVRHQRGL